MIKTPQIKDIQRALAQQSLVGFIYATMPGYQMGWVHEEICAEMDAFLEGVAAGTSPRLMLACPPRHGKLCSDNTPVLTPEGWTTHGALKCGDYVFHPSGAPVKVVGVGPKAYATHRVSLTNSDKIDVHLDHEWRIYLRPQARYKTVETRFFVEPIPFTGKARNLSSGPLNKRGHRFIYQIDVASALHFSERKHTLPPYVLGVWLGDGTSIAPRINMTPEDAAIIKPEFEKLGVPVTGEWVHGQTGVVTFSFGSGVPNVRNEFSQELKRLDLLNNKHIPEEYLFSSLPERLELLSGLIDTDGSYDAKTNRYRFITVSERLAEDVAELVRFCGAPCHVNKVKPDERDRAIKAKQALFCVSFFPDFVVPCRLERKNNKGSSIRRKAKRIGIANVEALAEPVQGNCIQVDAPDGLYLVGRHLTATHNSEIASRRFPAYALGRYPDISIIGTSYSSDLASRMNRDVQRIIETPEYADIFPDTTLSGKNIRTSATGNYLRNSDIFEVVNHKGAYRSAGVGGGITGMGCDIAIIDDPFKSRAEADSATIRESVWEWYISTLYTRLSPGGGIILINTRWHMDDLSGRLLEAERMGEGDKWRLVNFPAISDTDEKHRKAGEALHPERYPIEQLQAIRRAIGLREWEALYQQRPTPDGGNIFKEEWLKFWTPQTLPKNFDGLLMSWDMAFKDGDNSDYVVGQVWGRSGANRYLLDQVRGRMGFTDTVAAFRAQAEKWPQARRKLIEDKANGPAVIDSLRHAVSGIIPVNPDGSKTARAHAVTTYFEAGNVFLPHPQLFNWVPEYISELTQFPGAAHDDQVDATTQALRDMERRPGLNINPANLRPVNSPYGRLSA